MSELKETVIKMIRDLPENVTLDDIMAELYFRQQVDSALNELDLGKGIPHKTVKERMGKWLTDEK
jgi:hypothetical protein